MYTTNELINLKIIKKTERSDSLFLNEKKKHIFSFREYKKDTKACTEKK